MGNFASREARNEVIEEARQEWWQDWNHGTTERYDIAYEDARERYQNTKWALPNNQSEPYALLSLNRRENERSGNTMEGP